MTCSEWKAEQPEASSARKNMAHHEQALKLAECATCARLDGTASTKRAAETDYWQAAKLETGGTSILGQAGNYVDPKTYGQNSLAMKSHVIFVPGTPSLPKTLHGYAFGESSQGRDGVMILANGSIFEHLGCPLDAAGVRKALVESLTGESDVDDPRWLAKQRDRLAGLWDEMESPEAISAIASRHRKLYYSWSHAIEVGELELRHEWAIDGDIEAIRAAGRAGIDLNVADGRPSPMHLAAAGAEIDPLDGWSMMPLHCAAQLDDCQALAALLSIGANPALRCIEGMTALMWAASRGSSKCVEVLAAVSDFDVMDRDGRRASDFAREQWPDLSARLDAEATARHEKESLAGTPGPPVLPCRGSRSV